MSQTRAHWGTVYCMCSHIGGRNTVGHAGAGNYIQRVQLTTQTGRAVGQSTVHTEGTDNQSDRGKEQSRAQWAVNCTFRGQILTSQTGGHTVGHTE